MLMHIERIPKQMRLMAPPLPQALKLRLVEVVLQDGPILGMRTLSDDDPGALARRQAPHVRKALLGDDDVEVVLGLVDVRAHGHDARDARGSVLDGRVDGVCMMLYLAERRKSAEPPSPFSIRLPMTQVELACA